MNQKPNPPTSAFLRGQVPVSEAARKDPRSSHGNRAGNRLAGTVAGRKLTPGAVCHRWQLWQPYLPNFLYCLT